MAQIKNNPKFLYHYKCGGNGFQVTWDGAKMYARCLKCKKIFLLLRLNSPTFSIE